MNCPQKYFTKQYVASAIAVFTVVISFSFASSVEAATGINRTINFQGKLVSSTGVNVADSTYTVVFSIYDKTTGGTALWSETQSVTTVDGIFRVSLGSSTPIPSNFNFNWDGVYLGMKVGADTEMAPRIRMAAVPYAFNAEKVAGLTVTDENGVASTSGTLKIPNGKTISFGGAFTTTSGNDLTFTTTGNTTLGLGGSGALTLVDTTTSQALTSKIIGNTGLTFTGATTDVTTGTNQDFVVIPNGTGLLGIGTTAPASFFHVYGGTQGGNALAIFDQRGASTNDLFTASSSGTPVFTITNTGGIKLGNSVGTGAQCLLGGTTASWGSCGGVGSSQWTTSGSNIYYNAGNVGIGDHANATTPLHLLSVAGSTTGNAALMVDQRTPTGDLFTASAAGSTKFVINNVGNVGIGTMTPTEKLALAGGNFLQTASGNPTLKGTYNTSGFARGVTVSGKYAYVADDTAGLQVIDISNPASPTLMGTYDTSGTAIGVAVAGKYAYVADAASGLQVIDVSTPTSPTLVGTYDTSGSARGVTVVGKYAYVGDLGSGLQVIDVSNPANPILVGTYDTSGSARGVMVVGKYAYVADDTAGLRVIDVSNPASPTLIGTYDTSGSAFGVSVSGKYAYVADQGSGLQIINISIPATPTLVGTYDTSGSAYEVKVAGRYAYVSDDTVALQVIDISTPATPTLVGSYTTGGASNGVVIAGKYAYVADQGLGLQVIDINGVEAPSLYAGVLGANTLHVMENGDIANSLNVGNGLTVGGGGIYAQGALSVHSGVTTGNIMQGAPNGNALLTLNQLSTTQDIFTASTAGSTKFVINNNGYVGIGTTTPTTAKLVLSESAGPTLDMQQIVNSTGTSTTGVDGLQIDFANAGTGAITNSGLTINATSNNTNASSVLYGMNIGNLSSGGESASEIALRIGTGWDQGLVIETGSNDGTGFVYSGGGRPTKTITLSPEYAGAVVTAYYGAGTDTNVTGSMTSDADTTQGTSIRNYYQWERTTDATQHYYTVAVRVTLPKDFSAWATSNAVTVSYVTESATNTVSDLDVRIYNENSATVVSATTDQASTSWTTVAIDDSVLDDNVSSEWDEAGETAVIYLRMGSASSNHVRVGDIQLNYLAKF